MFGKKTLREQYVKFADEILEGKRRSPQHDHPTGLRGRYPSSADIDPVDQHFFNEAFLLGPTLDWHTVDAWSFEETSHTMRMAWYLDSPDYGRRWVVYYNNLKLGWMEASAAPERLFGTVEEFVASPNARIDMMLHELRWVPAEHVFGLLYQAALLMEGSDDGYDTARQRGRQVAESAMMIYNWEVNRAGDEYVPIMEFSTEGPYSVYRETIAGWQASGFDVLARRLDGEPALPVERHKQNRMRPDGAG